MSINSIDLKLPQLNGVCLSELHQGDVFMLINKERQKVVRLSVTIQCNYCSPDNDDGLPF